MEIIEADREWRQEEREYDEQLQKLHRQCCGLLTSPSVKRKSPFYHHDHLEVEIEEKGESFMVELQTSADNSLMAVIVRDQNGFVPQILYLTKWPATILGETRFSQTLGVQRIVYGFTDFQCQNGGPTIWNRSLFGVNTREVTLKDITDYQEVLGKVKEVLGSRGLWKKRGE